MTDPTTASTSPSPGPHEADDRPTGMAAALGGQIAAVFLAAVVAAVFLVETINGKPKIKPGVGPVLWSLVPLWICLIGAVVIAARIRGESVPVLVRLRWTWPDPLYAVLGVALQFAAALVYIPFSVSKAELEKPAKEIIGRAHDLGPSFWLLALALVIGAPAVEELFYRGLLLPSIDRVLKQWVGRRSAAIGAVVLSASWFALAHFEVVQFPALVLVGLVCGAVALRTGRLWPSFFIHLGFNLVTVIELGRRIGR